ncbi:MAG: AAA family ATPase [Clostridia bacterium]|nr:AAA family ATPase [Clostridia bacterium]
MKKSIVINLMGGPGAGKSTMASMLFAKLKMQGVLCEYVTEYAKDMVWENRYNILNDQLYILAKQFRRLNRINGEVDVIITDSPLLASLYYNSAIQNPTDRLNEETLKNLILELNAKFNNIYFFVERRHKYEQQGRYQTESESIQVAKKIRSMLDGLGINYKVLPSGEPSVDYIVNEIKGLLNDKQDMLHRS